MYLSVGMAALFLGVSVSTLRRWEHEEKLLPSHRTIGGHRRYNKPDLVPLIDRNQSEKELVHAIAYARVSSRDQMGDFETHVNKLTAFCQQHFPSFEVISDLGSGINFKKPGLKKLIESIHQGKFSHLILNHKDRLLRFGSELIFSLCKQKNIAVIILEEKSCDSFEVELSQDVIELMTVFCAKLYGKRSHQNKRKVEVKAA